MLLLTVDVTDETGTVALAEDLAAILRPGDVIALEGDLGMGKSALSRALIRALADDPDLEVPSPTFTIVQAYDLPRFPVAHFDLYRLGDPDELREIGFDEAIRTGAVLVEWPDRAGRDLPADVLTIRILDGATATGRRFQLDGPSAHWGDRLDRTRRIRWLLENAGMSGARRRYLQGDASPRAYERAFAAGRVAVVMNWPRRPPQPVLADGLSYPELVHVQDDPVAFAAVGQMLRNEGFKAPEIHAADLVRGLLVMEDLGAEPIAVNGQPIPDRYLAAAELLAEKDAVAWPDRIIVGDRNWVLPDYDARAMLVELSLCPDWYLPHATGRPVSADDREAFLDTWRPLADQLAASERGLVLRDVHSPNLIWLGGDDPRTRLGLIDFQDAMLGPTAYDLVSLATDVRVAMPPDLRAGVVDAYVAARRARAPGFDRAALDAAFAIASAQRNTKILGGFARSALRDGKPGYLAHIPRILALVSDAMAHPVLAPLRLWYERHRILS